MGRSTILAAALLVAVAVSAPVEAGPIVGEWDPGLTAAEVGGPLIVDGYGVNGLGVYQVRLGGGTTGTAVCVQADVGHSMVADYAVEPGATFAAELGYLTWAYLSAGAASDVEAAALNVLAWRYTGAQRSTGGPVWHGDEVEVRALGVGRLTDVEEAVRRLHAEATGRQGPWAFDDLILADGSAAVGITGPGGPIAGVPVTFTGGAWSVVVDTGPDGRAAAAIPPDVTALTATADGPGGAVALVAPGSQRLAMAGPPVLLTATAVTAPTSTTTSSTTTTLAPTTTLPPTTTSTTLPPSTTTTVPPTTTTTLPSTSTSTSTSTTATTSTTSTTSTTATTSTTTTTTTTTVPPPTTTSVASPPTLPRTGGGSRGVVRVGALVFAIGSGAVLVAAPRRRRATR